MIRDLLNPALGYLELREDSRGVIQVAGITEVSTINAKEASLVQTARGSGQEWWWAQGSRELPPGSSCLLGQGRGRESCTQHTETLPPASTPQLR